MFITELADEVALPKNPNILYWREIDLMGSYSSSYRVQAQAAEIVFDKRIDVDVVVSDRYPLSELGAALDRAVRPGAETYKILIYPEEKNEIVNKK